MQIKVLNLPELKATGTGFMWYNTKLESLSIPLCKEIGYGSLFHNNSLKKVCLSKLAIHRGLFLFNHNLYRNGRYLNVQLSGSANRVLQFYELI